MTVSLTKGGNVSLVKAGEQAGVSADKLTTVQAELGWDVRTTTGTDFDLDAQAIVVNAAGKVLSNPYFVFFNNLQSPNGEVKLSGDNLTGEGDGPDETITVDLAALPAEADKVVLLINIYDAENRNQTFGQVRNAFVRIAAAGKILVNYDLGEDYATETVLVAGELYRSGAEWKFRAVGEGYASLKGIAQDYGVDV